MKLYEAEQFQFSDLAKRRVFYCLFQVCMIADLFNRLNEF